MTKTIKLTKINRNEYKKFVKFHIIHGYGDSPFGKCHLAIHNNKLCFLKFYDNTPPDINDLIKLFPNSILQQDNKKIQQLLSRIFEDNDDNCLEVLVKGTQFEIEVWEALLKIKRGSTCSYEDVAIAIGNPKGVRATARAIAKNYVSYFIPCHRVIAKNGSLHKYGGGPHRKAMMLRAEGAI